MMRRVPTTTLGAVIAIAMLASLPASFVAAQNRTILPLPEPKFEGVVGNTYKESKAAWPKLPTPPAGAPNVVVILLDDVGFGQVSTFGGPVPTPRLDKLAAEGLRYTRFHTTAICGPSRAALITGRNHHNAGSGFLAEWATGFPSYNNMIPKSTATVAAILKGNGYATSWFGKNHNTPDWESSVAGPFDRWPTGMGFEYFYGFIGGETHQYYPVIFENTKPVEPKTSPEQGYHFMADMTDKAIEYMRYSKSVAPQKPLFLYFAPGAHMRRTMRPRNGARSSRVSSMPVGKRCARPPTPGSWSWASSRRAPSSPRARNGWRRGIRSRTIKRSSICASLRIMQATSLTPITKSAA
jgi:hypothetical protein